MQPKYFLFGLIRIERYEYLYGHTAAQIELMTYDVPITVYKADNNKPKPGEKGFERTAAQANIEYQRWLDRREKERNKGVKVNLDNFLSNGEEEIKKIGV